MSGSDLVTVIDYRTKKVVAEVPVGRHPQRVRDGLVDGTVLRAWKSGAASSTPDLSPIPAGPAQLQAAAAWMAAAIAAITT
jgi:YVTN family beta-propeller protein